MEYIYGILVVLLCLNSEVEGRRKWRIVADSPQPKPIDLIHPVEPESRITYNDEKSRMTVIQDSDINACFLTNYDPEWNLSDNERLKLASSLAAQTIRSPIEFLNFKTKVGDVISFMCKHRKLFWMTRPKVPPRPQMYLVQHGYSQIHKHPPPGPPHRMSGNIPHPQPHHTLSEQTHHVPPVQLHQAPPPQPHHAISAVNAPAPVPERYIVPFRRTLRKVSEPSDAVSSHNDQPKKL